MLEKFFLSYLKKKKKILSSPFALKCKSLVINEFKGMHNKFKL